MGPSFELRREPLPVAVEPASDPDIQARLRDEIARDGPVTFARFMEVALYDPDHGYYTATAAPTGRDGDFLTAPELHPVFGRLVGRFMAEVWTRLGRPDRFVVRDAGAGSGILGRTIVAGLAEDEPDLARALVYQPLEVSERRVAAIREAFAGEAADRLAAPDGEVVGAIVANELLDALPVHRVRGTASGIEELFVGWHDGGFVWRPGPPSDPALAERLTAEGVRLAEGQMAEVCLAVDDWLADVAATLRHGVLLVIDYGDEADALYSPARPDGTLRAYVGQRAHADPLRSVGRQDLTAHVDLTAVRRAAAAAGLRALGETTKARFVSELGLGDLLAAAGSRELIAGDRAIAEYVELRAAVVRLLDPRALGGFRVLAFGRGVDPEPPLRGFGT